MYDYTDHGEKVHRGPPGVKWLEPTDSLEGHLNNTDLDYQVSLSETVFYGSRKFFFYSDFRAFGNKKTLA